MSEQLFWKYLKRGLVKANQQKIHLERVESHALSSGTPDVDFCIVGHMGKIELKYANDDNPVPDIRPSQVRWMRKRFRAGGNVWVLTQFFNDKEDMVAYGLTRGDKAEGLALAKTQSQYLKLQDFVWADELNFSELISLITVGRFFREAEQLAKLQKPKLQLINPKDKIIKPN